ncbi:MAG: LacI family DNA-binding transcriptional regulator [Lachnospiraceae bacterium]|nr:LacI family DNA-binding transcriptional regulator [Lachnospiraceae bacterium]
MSDQLTIKDIAKYCGVGVSTVSRAINDDPGISPKTKERVLKVVKKFHYVPNNSARNLKMQESNTIALIVRGVDNIFFQSMFDGFQNELYKNGYDFLFHLVDSNTDVASSAIELVKEKRLKGVIILGGQMENPYEDLEQLGVPYVLCTVAHSMYTPTPNVNLVAIDDAMESFKAVRYLIDKGHRRIAIISGLKGDYSVGGQRLRGYKKALEGAGIPIDDDLIGYMREDIPEFTTENGYAVAKELLQRTDFTALYCISDMTAIGAYKAISEAGLSIPDDLSVIGFDGIDLGRFTIPALTTIKQPKDEMVKSSVDLLMKAIKGDDTPRQLFYPASLLERESVRSI